MRRLEAEESEVPDKELIELVLRNIGLEYIPKHAIHVQKYYMRHPSGSYLGLNTSVQQFVERLNDLNRYLLYFPEENRKQLDQDEIIEILDQAKAWDLESHEAMVNANIDIFEMSYEESVCYFKCLENLEKIRRTNSPNPSSLPVDNEKSFTSSVGKSSKHHKGSNIWCHYCDKNNHNTADCRAIAKSKPQRKTCFEAKSGTRNKSLAFPFEEINAFKRQLKHEKTASSKKRKAESILSTEISLTTSSDEGEQQEYLFTASKPFSTSKTKLAKSSHPTNNH
jgi:hypothetical protein